MEKKHRKIRVLHIAANLDCGGTETWLANVFERIDRERYQFDFLVWVKDECFYDSKFEKLGSKIYRVAGKTDGKKNIFSYLVKVFKFLKYEGPFDILHCPGFYAGVYAAMAKMAGIPVRIAHAHTYRPYKNNIIMEKITRSIKKIAIKMFVTHGLAASESAAINMFGKGWRKDKRFSILYCGIILPPIMDYKDDYSIRREFGIPESNFVIGHVGRFELPKNHEKIIGIFKCYLGMNPESYLILAGDGPRKQIIIDKIRGMNINGKVIFAGVRNDVSKLYKSMDSFLFPSLYEGLGLAFVEAQAAGLPCIISDTIPKEADIITELITRISLKQADSVWAEEITKLKGKPRRKIEMIRFKRFDIYHNIEQLCKVYDDSINNVT